MFIEVLRDLIGNVGQHRCVSRSVEAADCWTASLCVTKRGEGFGEGRLIFTIRGSRLLPLPLSSSNPQSTVNFHVFLDHRIELKCYVSSLNESIASTE